MKYEIESGIKIPETGKHHAYPIAELEVGQSFFVPCEDCHLKQASINSICRNYKPKKFSIRQIKTLPEKGVRVWRVL